MNLSQTLDNAKIFANTIDNKLDGLALDGDVRSRVFNVLLHLSLEHYSSTILLMRSRMNGSAAALLRPQYEAFMRGLYYLQCASEKEIELFIEGKEPKKLYKIVEQLESNFAIENNPITNIYSSLKRKMHGFTHGGLEQLQRRFNGSEIIGNYSDEACLQIITLSHILAIYAATFTAAAANKEELASEFVKEVNNLYVYP